MILSDATIRLQMEMGFIVVDPEPADRDIQPASIDLYLSEDLRYFPQGSPAIDILRGSVPKMAHCKIKAGYTLSPGQFVLGSTVERIEVPRHLVARVEGKSSLGRIGLSVHVTAGFIDPGFRGNITLELKNVNNVPIVLREGMPISQLCFESMTTPAARPYGSEGLGSKYQDSKGTASARTGS